MEVVTDIFGEVEAQVWEKAWAEAEVEVLRLVGLALRVSIAYVQV